jgi:nitrogen fixation-related uncharacterized protein
MEVLILTVFASLMLVAAALSFFAWTLRQRSHEHIDRLTLLPLGDDSPAIRTEQEGKQTCK